LDQGWDNIEEDSSSDVEIGGFAAVNGETVADAGSPVVTADDDWYFFLVGKMRTKGFENRFPGTAFVVRIW
jgi:hypothetical protein